MADTLYGQRTSDTYFEEALRVFYLPAIREQLDNATPFMKTLTKSEDVSGRYAHIVLQKRRNMSARAVAEGGTLPNPSYQQYEESTIGMKYNYARIQLTGQVIAASKNDKGSVTRALDSEVKGAVRDLKRDVSRQLMGAGDGRLAQVNGTVAADTTVTLDHPGTRYLAAGMVWDAGASGSSASEEDITITTVDSATQITTSANCTLTDNHFITKIDSTNTEMMGIAGITDDATITAVATTFQGITLSTNAYFKGNAVKASTAGNNRTLDESLVQEAMTLAESNGGTVSAIVLNAFLRDKFANILIGDKRFVNTLDLQGGWKTLGYNGIPLLVDNDSWDNEIYFLDMSTIALYRMSDYDWMDRDGAILSRNNDLDAYEATLFLYANLGTDCRNKNSVLRDIDQTVGKDIHVMS